MNTRTSEIRLILSAILKEALQQGITPDFLELTASGEFDDLGKVKTGEPLTTAIASSSDINSNIDSIELNTKIIDECAALQADKTISHRNTFASRINRLERWYRNLAYRAESLVLLTRKGTRSVHVITDTFSSLSNIDTDNTTAYIDTINGQAEIPSTPIEDNIDTETGRANVSISGARIIDGGEEVDIPFQSNSLYYIYNSINTKDVKLILDLNINTNNKIFNGSSILFNLALINTTDITSVISSSDNINKEVSTYLQTYNHISIPISRLYKSNRVSIILNKNGHDAEKILDNGDIQHSFVFSIQDIRIPNKKYRDSAVVQTVDFELPNYINEKGISMANLEFTSQCLGDTYIKSYIAYDDGDFFSITPGKPFPIGDVKYKQTSHPSGQVIREVPTPLFRLEGLTENPVTESATLLEGYQQVEVETKPFVVDASSLSSWVVSPGTKAYQDMKSGNIWLGGECSHKIYFCIKSNKSKDITLSNLGVRNNINSSVDVSSYMYFNFNGQPINGRQLPDGSMEYKLPLVQGINKVNILIGVSGETGGYFNVGDISSSDTEVFVKERHCASLPAIMSLDDTNKAFAVKDGKIYLNYIPPINAKFIHRFSTPTTNLPATMKLKFDLIGAGGLSPILYPYKLEFTPVGY